MRPTRPSARAIAIAACIVMLGGCTTVKGWFGGNKNKEAKPAPLVEFTPSLNVVKMWTVDLGEGEERIGVRQRPVVADGRVYAAAADSAVRALDLQTGKPLWSWGGGKDEKKKRYAGGPGVGGGIVAVGSLDGDVVILDAASGAEKWRARLQNEVIAAPAIAGGMVFVRSNDGRVTAFDAANGQKRWAWRADMPALTVRGNAGLTLGPGYVFVGNDNGKMVALSATDGSELWTSVVAQPEGRSELDRMNDVDGQPVLVDTTLYATSYKPHTQAIEAPTGRVLWSQENGGIGGTGVGGSIVAVSDVNDVVWGLDRNTGAPMWKQPAFPRRRVSGPAVLGDYVVVGDYDGYLHWLSASDGRIVARIRLTGKPIRAQPVVADGILLVQDTDGNLGAYRPGQ